MKMKKVKYTAKKLAIIRKRYELNRARQYDERFT